MAAKKVQNVLIDLNIQGAEKLAALKGSFRDLGKTIGQTDVDIDAARKSVIEYGKTANQSEALVKGQIKAFEGLREQAQMGGKVYRELSNDIATLKSQLNGSTPAIDAQRKSILELASGAEVTAKQLGLAVDKLFALRNETRLDSAAFNALGKDIDGLNGKIASLAEQAKRTASENRAAALSVSNTLAKTEASAQKQIASSARREQTVRDEILALSEKKKATDELIKKENQLTAAISRRRQLSVQEAAREARRRVRAGAQVYTGAVELGPVDALDQRLGDLPNTTAAFSQRLSELQDRLVNTVRGGDQYIQVALRIAQVQREASAATQGLGAALIKDLASGAAVRSQKNLREVIGQLQAEMSELNTETAEGSAKYAENARQVNNLQKELDDIANSYRTVTDMARQATAAQGQYANTAAAGNYLRRGIVRAQEAAAAEMARAITQGAAQTPLLLPAAGGTTAPGTGAFMSGGARPEIPGASRLYSSTGERPDQPSRGFPGDVQAISSVRGSATGGPSGQSYAYAAEARRRSAEAAEAAARAEANYRAEIDKATRANDGSINSSNRLRSALEQFRSTLPTTSREFDKLTDQINRLDRESEKVSRRMSRRRMSPMQMTQAAGAVLSGGIFGGPEGFLGGAIGSLGGVGGAFAGAAIGAQVGGIRRTLGEYADYAAQITRLNIALEGIAGSQDQYNRALQAAADVTAQLNVPQEVAVQGMTRLVAAVKGAGGGVAEAEVAFKNINSAIIATGGGAEQVQGAVTALVQIFSKGKVSAEEINQIAERLPGTFNKIAAASGRTGPELTKALQQGTVGLNDLMKFLVSLGDEYGELAQKIAGSSENAGARLQVAFNEMRIEVGNALQPIGAEFQSAFAEFIKEITPSLVKASEAVGEGLRFVIQNKEAVGVAASFALKLTAVTFALKAFAALNGPISAMFTLLKSGFKASSQQAALAQGKLLAFGRTVKTLAASLVAPVVITFAVIGAEMVISYFNRIKKARQDLEATATKPQGEVFFRSIGGTAATKQTLQRNINDITKNLGILRDRVKSTKEEIASYQRTVDSFDPSERGFGVAAPRQEVVPEDLKARLQADEAEINRLVLNYRTLVDKYLDAPDEPGLKTFPDTALDKDGSGSGKKRESRAPQLAQELIYLTSAAQIKEKIRASELDGNKMLQIRLEGELRLLEFAKQSALINLKDIPANEKQLEQAKLQLEAEQARLDTVKSLALEGQQALEKINAPLKNLIREYEKEARTRERLNELIKQGVDEGLAEEFVKIEEIIQAQRELLDQKILYAEAALAVKDIEEGVREELEKQLKILKKQKEELPEKEDKAKGAAKDAQEPEKDFFGKLDDAIEAQRDALKDLVDPINQVVSAANAIGDAFKNSFKSVIDGSSSAKQALSDFFKSVGDYFLDMAAEIAAAALKLAALQFVKFIIQSFAAPQIGSGTGAPVPGKVAPNGQPYYGPAFAEGGYVSGGFKAFKSGGMVSQPTVGLVGEGSESEYIIPESKMRESMNRYSRGVRGPGVIPENGGATTMEGEGNIAVAAPIDVRYTVERINQVDYVTADEFRRGMKQAAQQGASEGQQRTLYALRQNTTQRRRIGI